MFIYQFEQTAGRRQWENMEKVCRLLDCLADVDLEYTRMVNTNDDSKTKKSIEEALQQERGSDQIGTGAFVRGCKDKYSARNVRETNPEAINKALKQLKTSISNQMAIYGSKRANYDHRQVYFADGAVSPTIKGNMSSP